MDILTTLQQLILDPLSPPFMQRSILGVLIIGVVCGVVGAYVVTRGMAFLGDAMAHTVLPGVAIAYLAAQGGREWVMVGGMIAGLLSAVGIGFLTRGGRLSEDTAIGVVFAGALALGIGIISLAGDYSADLGHLLIGNVLGITNSDLLVIAIVALSVILIVIFFYKEFLIISFDLTFARSLRLPAESLRLLLLVLLAMTVVISLEAVGVVMVAALLVTPAATARFFVKQLHWLMILAAFIGALGGLIGMYAAWHTRIAPSAAIVLTLTVMFILAFLFAPSRGYVWSLLGRTAERA
jgi:ABC-type Mn2+/Zn2+ transport system permease subunit